ncbi:uncharacterized protein [Pleurodeles waltl]|uniref:uncharacterized protein isoform X2 n=1 Tax=Pleurodeles waltl TaxID=8319 RepID=UPI003709B3E6
MKRSASVSFPCKKQYAHVNKNEKQKRDVPAEFRSDEWKLLHHWQQDLYKNVMKEIQQAFNSLGPLIANSVFSLRPNEKEDLCSVDHEDLETKGRTNLSTNVAVDSDVLLKKTGNDNEYLKNSLDTHCKGRRDGPGTGYQFADTVNIVRIEEELGSSIADHYCAEKQERNSRPNLVSVAAGPAVASFRIKSEGEPFSADQLYCDRRENIVGTRFPFLTTDVQASLSNIQDTQREESSFCISSGHEGTTVGINEVGELYPLNIKDCERRENIHSALGDGSMGIQKEVAESIQSTKTTSSYLPPLKEKQTEVIHVSYKGRQSTRQPRIQSFQKRRGGKTLQFESSLSNTDLCVDPRRDKVRLLPTYNESESSVISLQFPTDLQNTLRKQTPYTCTQCDKSYYLKTQLIRHMRIHSGVTGYACTVCEKSFFSNTQLLKHYRTHTGERPHICTLCNKSFSRKDILDGHLRIHSGDKPYKCTDCDRSFPWKSNLNHHRRKHH